MSIKNKYQNGKIFQVVDMNTGKAYIGSTVQRLLSNVLSKYRTKLKANKQNELYFEVMKGNNYRILLLESYPCANINELDMRTHQWIENNECINKRATNNTASAKKTKRPNIKSLGKVSTDTPFVLKFD